MNDLVETTGLYVFCSNGHHCESRGFCRDDNDDILLTECFILMK
jgi:hypothetical protein